MRDALATLAYSLCTITFLLGLAAATLHAVATLDGVAAAWIGIPAGLVVSAFGFAGMDALEPRGED